MVRGQLGEFGDGGGMRDRKQGRGSVKRGQRLREMVKERLERTALDLEREAEKYFAAVEHHCSMIITLEISDGQSLHKDVQ